MPRHYGWRTPLSREVGVRFFVLVDEDRWLTQFEDSTNWGVRTDRAAPFTSLRQARRIVDRLLKAEGWRGHEFNIIKRTITHARMWSSNTLVRLADI
jgi:hypothetical protein